MKKFLLSLVFLLTIGALVACGNSDNANNNDELPVLEVDFKVPETADPGDEVTLEAHVTYDGEPVDDVDEIEFEIWQAGDQDNSEMIEPENEGDGIYTLEYTFEDEAAYEMYAHTTAHDMHTMPKKTILVGDAEMPEEDEDNNHDMNHDNMDHNDMNNNNMND